jgi:AAA domain-containing protein/UvrD-like helicase family protein
MHKHLTPHQQHSLDWVVTRIKAGAPLVALRGLAGTGKTTLIPALHAALRTDTHPVLVGTPTHRAAMMLHRKGVLDAATVHSLCLTPYFTKEYATAVHWLGGAVATSLEYDTTASTRGSPTDVPALVLARLADLGSPPSALYALRGTYEASALLASIGIHGRHHLIGFGPKPASPGVLIIDEASMVGRALLALCQQGFGQVILVGDPGQLPPVQDVAVLDTVEGVQLSEIHRQAGDSPLLQLAHRAREGYAFWRHGLAAYAPTVVECQALPARVFLAAPLLTWKNATRVGCTRMIREALGYPADQLVVGEPLVCRSTDQAARVDGFYNNALFRVAKTAAHDAREVTLIDDLTGEERVALVHLEEMDGDNVELDAIPFRFGYAMTVHTAQGGEWPTVYISKPDLVSYAGFCWHQGRMDNLARWAYTAVTRAKQGLGLLTQHCFVK